MTEDKKIAEEMVLRDAKRLSDLRNLPVSWPSGDMMKKASPADLTLARGSMMKPLFLLTPALFRFN